MESEFEMLYKVYDALVSLSLTFLNINWSSRHPVLGFVCLHDMITNLTLIYGLWDVGDYGYQQDRNFGSGPDPSRSY